MLKTPLFLVSLMLVAGPALAEVAASRQNELMHLLKQDCGSCHGMTLKGGLGPALLPAQLKGKPIEYLVTTILEGHPNTAMPPWNTMLSPDDALWLANQIKQGIK